MVDTVIWTTLEPTVAILAACTPACRLLLRRNTQATLIEGCNPVHTSPLDYSGTDTSRLRSRIDSLDPLVEDPAC